jgi:CPA2 family monovalent cation:H+ antiporter-2
VTVVLVLQRLQVPTILAYLLVGVLVGPHTPGPIIDPAPLRALAEFGIVFLLFTIGLSFSLPQLHSLRHLVLGLGTAQVALTTAAVAIVAWLAGLPAEAAFVVGAVFAQSSTTVIERQLVEQREDQSRHGRLSVAMSVFQDVTAVPFVVVIPVLGASASAAALGGTLGIALAKAVLAFALVFAAGRWLLPPLFHLVAQRRSLEVFTLTVLFVSLAAGSVTQWLGLSMAFGAFLAGMMLGETEFRHQVEAAIRPFRDVLLGLFFVGIGMLFDPVAVFAVWHWVVAGTLALLGIKALLVAAIVRAAGIDAVSAWRTAFSLAVGGEFGFALLAIALGAQVIEAQVGQIALASVLLSMIAGTFLIRYSHAIALRLAPESARGGDDVPLGMPSDAALLSGHVIICGYGRIGQNVGRFLEEERIPYVALDLDPARVKQAHLAGERVFYADSSERDILEAVGIASARLVVVSHDDVAAALAVLRHVRALRPELPVMVRTRDETHVEALRAAGATEVVPETLEAGLMIATHALLLLEVPLAHVVRRFQRQRSSRYRLLREFFRGGEGLVDNEFDEDEDRMKPVLVPTLGAVVGRTLGELRLDGVVVTALVRRGKRSLAPSPQARLEAGDAVVLFGPAPEVAAAERILQG